MNSGTENSGTENSGTENSGTENSGTENSGTENSGTENSGTENSGTENSGTDPAPARTECRKVEGAEIVAAARECLGTPWHHAARLPGVGLDCAGLLIVVARRLGVPVEDDVNYTLGHEFDRLTGHLNRYCECLPLLEQPQEGDILVFQDQTMPNHCGILARPEGIEEREENEGGPGVENAWSLIHAWRSVGSVVEHPLTADWFARIVRHYRFRQDAFDQDAFDQDAFDQDAFDQDAFDQDAFDQDAFDQDAFNDVRGTSPSPQ